MALPTPGKNVREGLVGAVRYPTGDFRFSHQPKSATTALFLAMLKTLVKRAKRTGRCIEMWWAALKSQLRRLAPRALDEIAQTVRRLCTATPLAKLTAWFRHCLSFLQLN